MIDIAKKNVLCQIFNAVFQIVESNAFHTNSVSG